MSRLDEASPLLCFYRGKGVDTTGRSLAQLQSQGLEELERVHDYIQWLFPLEINPVTSIPARPC